jgi:hypothetical protein
MLISMHPAARSLLSRLGPVCFGDVSPSGNSTLDRNIKIVLDFVNRFAPPDRPFQNMEQVAADHTLFGSTLDEEERLISGATPILKDEDTQFGVLQSAAADDAQRQKATSALADDEAQLDAPYGIRAFRTQRAWVAHAIVTFRRFGYDGLSDPDMIPDSESGASEY